MEKLDYSKLPFYGTHKEVCEMVHNQRRIKISAMYPLQQFMATILTISVGALILSQITGQLKERGVI